MVVESHNNFVMSMKDPIEIIFQCLKPAYESKNAKVVGVIATELTSI